MYTFYDATNDTLDRLSDLENVIWSRAEIQLYLKDGYDNFVRQTNPFFDCYMVENLPPAGNWQTDLEKYFAQQRPGWGLTDERLMYTQNEQTTAAGSVSQERFHGTEGKYGGSYGPMATGMTSPGDRAYVTGSDGLLANAVDAVPVKVPGGTLPDRVTDLLRVTFNQRTLVGISSMQAKYLDPAYEVRGTGYPQFFTWDKDGLMFLRVIPAMAGVAVYDTVDGSWGTMTYTTDTAVTVVTTEVTGHNTGGYGMLVHRTDMFPTEGPYGTPTRVHPTDLNCRVEVFRLGHSLDDGIFELPDNYLKYVIFWAMYKAMLRDGPGQDLELAEHYKQRFEMGIEFLTQRRARMNPERFSHFRGMGQFPVGPMPFGMGDPQPPYPFGTPEYDWRL